MYHTWQYIIKIKKDNKFEWRLCNRPACTDKVTLASCCWWWDFQCYAPNPPLVHSAGPELQSWSPCPEPQTDPDWWNLPTVRCSAICAYNAKQCRQKSMILSFPELAYILWSYSRSDQRRTTGITEADFQDAIRVTQPTGSKQWREVKAMISTGEKHSTDLALSLSINCLPRQGMPHPYTSSLTQVHCNLLIIMRVVITWIWL